MRRPSQWQSPSSNKAKKGIEKGARNSVLTLIDAKFGLTKAISDRIEAMSLSQLQDLLRHLIDSSKSLADLGLAEANGLAHPQNHNGRQPIM